MGAGVYCQMVLDLKMRKASRACLHDLGYLNIFRHFSLQISPVLCHCLKKKSNYNTVGQDTLNPMLLPASLSLFSSSFQMSIFHFLPVHTLCVFSPVDWFPSRPPSGNPLSDAHIAIRNDDYKDGLITWNKLKYLSITLYEHMRQSYKNNSVK